MDISVLLSIVVLLLIVIAVLFIIVAILIIVYYRKSGKQIKQLNNLIMLIEKWMK